MYAIPVIPKTLDLIEKLNDGVRPLVELDKEGHPTLYIYRDNGSNEIVSHSEFHKRFWHRDFWADVHLSYYIK